jgi:hypothetical protein
MSLRKINTRNSSFRKKDFFNALNLVYLTICSCRNRAISNKVYCVSNNSKKCVKYVQLNCNYNLTILSISIKQIYKKQLRLKKKVREAHTKLSRLKKQLNFLKNKEKKRIVIE